MKFNLLLFTLIVLTISTSFGAPSKKKGKEKQGFGFVVDTLKSDYIYSEKTVFQMLGGFEIPFVRYQGEPIKKGIDEMLYFNPGNSFGLNERRGERKTKRNYFPTSVRYYIQSGDLVSSCFTDRVNYKPNSINFNAFYQPFYFSKNMVTNAEYLEFVDFVKDSLFRQKLGGKYINSKIPIDFTDEQVVGKLMSFYIEEGGERFYKRKQIDADQLNINWNNEKLNVYPDTLCWVHDFSTFWTESMTQMYFWHPTYDHYPVVGITHKQARSFMKWKERQLRVQYVEKHPNLIFEVDFPSMREREFVLQENYNYSNVDENHFTMDEGFITDLSIGENENYFKWNGKVSMHERPLRKLLQENSFTVGNLTLDGAIHTNSKYIFNSEGNSASKKEMKTRNGIYFMSKNASEWSSHKYDQWNQMYNARRKNLLSRGREEDSLVVSIENYYHKRNENRGLMVVGGNWIDERHSLTLGENLVGAYAKRFVHPDSAHCTIGFRYVVRVKHKVDTNHYEIVDSRKSEPFYDIVKRSERWKVVQDTIVDTLGNREVIIVKVQKSEQDSSFTKLVRSCEDYSQLIALLPKPEKIDATSFLDSVPHKRNIEEYSFEYINENKVRFFRRFPSGERRKLKGWYSPFSH